ncbi:MAG: hypothetical protein ACFFC1_19675 [Promethearchaeota archaeon]
MPLIVMDIYTDMCFNNVYCGDITEHINIVSIAQPSWILITEYRRERDI